MELNITNGLYFNEYAKNKFEGVFIPFNEAMIDGELLFPLFDNNFVKKRIEVHNATKEDYQIKMQFFLSANNLKNYEVVNLWFGLDTFCQINMLTMLAYLEQIEYKGKIFYQAIDDSSFELVNLKTEICLGQFISAYNQLKNGQPIFTKYSFIDSASKDYLYLKNKNNRFYCYIRENIKKITEHQLMIDILNDSAQFGLSDVYIKKMIDEIKKE